MESNLDEIDLLKLSKIINTFFKLHVLYLLVFAIFGSLAAGLFTMIQKPEYKSSLTGVSPILTIEDISPIIIKLNNLIEEKNYEEVAKLIPLNIVSLSNIKNITVTGEALAMKNKLNHEDLSNIFHIDIQVFDHNLFDTLNTIIPSYINNTAYIKMKARVSMEKMTKNYERLDNEIKKLDSIGTKLTPGRISKDNLNLYMSNPGSINETIITLYEKQNDLYEKMQLNTDFIVIDNFAIYSKPTNKNYIKNTIIGSAIFFVLGLLFFVGKKFNSFISK